MSSDPNYLILQSLIISPLTDWSQGEQSPGAAGSWDTSSVTLSRVSSVDRVWGRPVWQFSGGMVVELLRHCTGIVGLDPLTPFIYFSPEWWILFCFCTWAFCVGISNSVLFCRNCFFKWTRYDAAAHTVTQNSSQRNDEDLTNLTNSCFVCECVIIVLYMFIHIPVCNLPSTLWLSCLYLYI